jgi:hypothetical protein
VTILKILGTAAVVGAAAFTAMTLTGCALQVGSARDPTGTTHEKYTEHWAASPTGVPVMTDCELSRDAGVEFQGAVAQWRPCGRQFDSNVAAEQAFAGQRIGAKVQEQSYLAWSQGFNTGIQSLLPLVCTAAAIAAAPPLAALCGVAKPTVMLQSREP